VIDSIWGCLRPFVSIILDFLNICTGVNAPFAVSHPDPFLIFLDDGLPEGIGSILMEIGLTYVSWKSLSMEMIEL
jgi:hypothetical protein